MWPQQFKIKFNCNVTMCVDLCLNWIDTFVLIFMQQLVDNIVSNKQITATLLIQLHENALLRWLLGWEIQMHEQQPWIIRAWWQNQFPYQPTPKSRGQKRDMSKEILSIITMLQYLITIEIRHRCTDKYSVREWERNAKWLWCLANNQHVSEIFSPYFSP